MRNLLPNFTKRQWLTLIIIGLADFGNAICVSLQAPFFPPLVSRIGMCCWNITSHHILFFLQSNRRSLLVFRRLNLDENCDKVHDINNKTKNIRSSFTLRLAAYRNVKLLWYAKCLHLFFTQIHRCNWNFEFKLLIKFYHPEC